MSISYFAKLASACLVLGASFSLSQACCKERCFLRRHRQMVQPLRCPTPSQTVDVTAVGQEITRIMDSNGFDPSIFTRGTLDTTKEDALMLMAHWDAIRGEIENVLAARLGRGCPPDLAIFLISNGVADSRGRTLSIAFASADDAVRRVFLEAFKTPSDLFRQMVITHVCGAAIHQTGAFRPDLRKSDGGLDLLKVGQAIGHRYRDDVSKIVGQTVQPGPMGRTRDAVQLQSDWIYCSSGPKAKYYWRVDSIVSRFRQDTNWWELTVKCDVGYKTGSMATVRWIGDNTSNPELLARLGARARIGNEECQNVLLAQPEKIAIFLDNPGKGQSLATAADYSPLPELTSRIVNSIEQCLTLRVSKPPQPNR